MSAFKVFAFDYACAGGPMTRQLPNSLKRHGEMMLRALLADLVAVPGVDVITIGDSRQPLSDLPSAVVIICGAGRFSQRFNACVQAADAVWPMAPESGGLLERVSRAVLRHKRVLLGSKPDAVRVATSKRLTARTLAMAGVAVVATYTPREPLPGGIGAWVVKPDNGAGCLDTRIFGDTDAALAWIDASGDDGYVLQPFVYGKLGSLSLLCCEGAARVLSCNEQRIAVRDNQFHFLGSTVNSLIDANGEFDRLAQKIAAAIPGLWGYVGVDFVLTEHGVVVLEVNPRMTTSCAGLHASIGCNPAGLVLDLLRAPGCMPQPVARPLAVSVDVEAFGVQ